MNEKERARAAEAQIEIAAIRVVEYIAAALGESDSPWSVTGGIISARFQVQFHDAITKCLKKYKKEEPT